LREGCINGCAAYTALFYLDLIQSPIKSFREIMYIMKILFKYHGRGYGGSEKSGVPKYGEDVDPVMVEGGICPGVGGNLALKNTVANRLHAIIRTNQAIPMKRAKNIVRNRAAVTMLIIPAAFARLIIMVYRLAYRIETPINVRQIPISIKDNISMRIFHPNPCSAVEKFMMMKNSAPPTAMKTDVIIPIDEP
jgi:hypothetical protein